MTASRNCFYNGRKLRGRVGRAPYSVVTERSLEVLYEEHGS